MPQFLDDIDEPQKKKQKTQKEIVLSDEEKQVRADTLMKQSVDNKNILGYVSDNNLFVKYNKTTGDYVVYNNNFETIYFDILTIRQYEANKWSLYMYSDEIRF